MTCLTSSGTDHILKRSAYGFTEKTVCRTKGAILGKTSGGYYAIDSDDILGSMFTRFSSTGTLVWTRFIMDGVYEMGIAVDDAETQFIYSSNSGSTGRITILNAANGNFVQRYKW